MAYRISRHWEVGNVDQRTTHYGIQGHNITIDKKSRILAVRWSHICFRNPRLGKMFLNKLFSRFRGAYMFHNVGYMKSLFTGQLEVV